MYCVQQLVCADSQDGQQAFDHCQQPVCCVSTDVTDLQLSFTDVLDCIRQSTAVLHVQQFTGSHQALQALTVVQQGGSRLLLVTSPSLRMMTT